MPFVLHKHPSTKLIMFGGNRADISIGWFCMGMVGILLWLLVFSIRVYHWRRGGGWSAKVAGVETVANCTALEADRGQSLV